MNAARFHRSPRLQRVLSVLYGGEWATTRDIIRRANVCAVNSCISELRADCNGFNIESRRVKGREVIYEYRLIEEQQFNLFDDQRFDETCETRRRAK